MCTELSGTRPKREWFRPLCLKDSFHKFSADRYALVDVHLKAAEHNHD